MKYLANGQEVEVVEQLEDGFLVRPILTDGYEEYAGNPEIAHRLFDDPPTAKLAGRIAALTSDFRKKQDELNAITEEIETATQERAQLIASLKERCPVGASDDPRPRMEKACERLSEPL